MIPVEGPLVAMGPKHPWSKGDILGQGSFGTVYDAVDSDGMWFAVKEVSIVEQDNQAQQSIAQLMQEIELLSQFKHDNVVQYLGTEKAHGKLYIFLELVSQGSLATICKRIKLTHSQISAYTRQILKGLKFLHDQHIAHRDIKCANILVDTNGTCKLADFGMAKQISSLEQMKSCKGSAHWMAPEVIDPKSFSGLPADIWSLGCCILEMETRSRPFGDMAWYQVLWTVGHGTAPPIPDTLSETAKDFVKHCLDVNPAKRSTATELLNHPFVRQDVALTPTSEDALATCQALSNTQQPIADERCAHFPSRPRWWPSTMNLAAFWPSPVSRTEVIVVVAAGAIISSVWPASLPTVLGGCCFGGLSWSHSGLLGSVVVLGSSFVSSPGSIVSHSGKMISPGWAPSVFSAVRYIQNLQLTS